jgi:prepilin-type N-terminal cleavage/methylation domain-containing protein
MCERKRSAFTLVELLVAMSIVVTIATMAVLLMPHITERTKATRAADNLQEYLLIARQTSLRNANPCGLRLIIDPGTNFVRTLQYIEQPGALQGGQLYYIPGVQTQVDIVGLDGSGGLGLNNPTIWPVQPGDYLQIQQGPWLLITGVTPNIGNSPVDTVLTTLSSAWPGGTIPLQPPQYTTDFKIFRAPRPRPGEDPLVLPTDIVIDMNVNMSQPPPIPGTNYDIMFAPSGPVIGTLGATTGKIILWVRDSTQDPANPGHQALITVYTRTGLIAAHPVNQAPGPGGFVDPYFYTRDPRNSGM